MFFRNFAGEKASFRKPTKTDKNRQNPTVPNFLFVTLQREINSRTAQNYIKIELKNFKKKGTKLTTTILVQSSFDNFKTNFLKILSAATQNKNQ